MCEDDPTSVIGTTSHLVWETTTTTGLSLSLSLSLTDTQTHTHSLSVSLSLFTCSPSLPSEEEYVIRPAFTSHVAKSMLSHLDKHQPDVKHGQGAPAAGAEPTFIAPTTGPLSMHEVMRRLW